MNCTKSSLKGVNVLKWLTFALQSVANREIFRAFDLEDRRAGRGDVRLWADHTTGRERRILAEREIGRFGLGKEGKEGEGEKKFAGVEKKL